MVRARWCSSPWSCSRSWPVHAAVAYGEPPIETPVGASASANGPDGSSAAPRLRHWAWADLMRRAFEIDVLACPRCRGRLRLIATIDDPDAVRAVLAASAVSRALADRAPPFAPPLGTSHGAARSA